MHAVAAAPGRELTRLLGRDPIDWSAVAAVLSVLDGPVDPASLWLPAPAAATIVVPVST